MFKKLLKEILISERRKDLTELIIIRVIRNVQKVIKREPDLMIIMNININDYDIHPGGKEQKINSNSNIIHLLIF